MPLDPARIAEAVAQALDERPDVEYAQASYRMHTLFVPNDPLYGTLQWNLPMINMEKAWDIQPQAGSSITVAVLDTGVAYKNATLDVTLQSFTDDDGVRYPALGRQLIPYSAAPQLVGVRSAVADRRAARLHLERRTRRRSISTATARTSAARSAS